MIDMAHYAFLDSNNVVTEVITGNHEDEGGIDWEVWYGDFRGQVCKRTSYNTRGNVHANGGVPFRGNYAGIGYIYREDIDAFVPPQPFQSWTLNANFVWQAPVDMPNDNQIYNWNESNQAWEVISGT